MVIVPHTYSTNLVHCVFSTKGRADLISAVLEERLHAYIVGTAKNLGIEILALGGTANHVHILMTLPPAQPLSYAMRDLKANSSRWMSEHGTPFAWQEGFGAFSVSPSQAPVVIEICSQSGGASQEAELRGGIPAPAEEIRNFLRSEACLRVVTPLRGSFVFGIVPNAHALG